MAAGWRYLLAESRDMSIIGELHLASDRALTVDNNKSGVAQCGYPIDAPHAGSVAPWETCLITQRDDEWFWSGPIHQRVTDFASGRVTIPAVGWFEKLQHILVQEKVQFSNEDASVIARTLLDLAREQDPTMPITIGRVELTQPRTITYDIDASIGQEIQNLAELESGYDWYVDPQTRELNIVVRRGVDRPNVKWLWIEDDPEGISNLRNVIETLDGSTVVNDIKPRGKFGTGFADDAASKARYGLFQEAPSLSDVPDTNILNAYANAEIVYRKDPRTTYQIFPRPSLSDSVPKMFEDFDIGDTTYLTARRGFVQVENQAVRVFGVSLNIDSSGAETITNLQTSAA